MATLILKSTQRRKPKLNLMAKPTKTPMRIPNWTGRLTVNLMGIQMTIRS